MARSTHVEKSGTETLVVIIIQEKEPTFPKFMISHLLITDRFKSPEYVPPRDADSICDNDIFSKLESPPCEAMENVYGCVSQIYVKSEIDEFCKLRERKRLQRFHTSLDKI